MKYSRSYQFRKSAIILVLGLLFSGISTGLNTNRVLSLLGVTPALAKYGTEERNNGERTIIIYDTRTILALTPRAAGRLFFTVNYGPINRFKIKGLSSNLSWKILQNMLRDIAFTKTLIRDVKNAKTRKEKLKVLERHKREQKKERKKLLDRAEALPKRQNGTQKKLSDKNAREINSLIHEATIITGNIRMINKWAKKLGKKVKKQKTGK